MGLSFVEGTALDFEVEPIDINDRWHYEEEWKCITKRAMTR